LRKSTRFPQFDDRFGPRLFLGERPHQRVQVPTKRSDLIAVINGDDDVCLIACVPPHGPINLREGLGDESRRASPMRIELTPSGTTCKPTSIHTCRAHRARWSTSGSDSNVTASEHATINDVHASMIGVRGCRHMGFASIKPRRLVEHARHSGTKMASSH
jgi:hypothetical protein